MVRSNATCRCALAVYIYVCQGRLESASFAAGCTKCSCTWSDQVMMLWSRPADLPTRSLGNGVVRSNASWIVRPNAAWMVRFDAACMVRFDAACCRTRQLEAATLPPGPQMPWAAWIAPATAGQVGQRWRPRPRACLESCLVKQTNITNTSTLRSSPIVSNSNAKPARGQQQTGTQQQ